MLAVFIVFAEAFENRTRNGLLFGQEYKRRRQVYIDIIMGNDSILGWPSLVFHWPDVKVYSAITGNKRFKLK